ncbi:MAG TPA: HD domain-containing protein [Ktedonobacteraceae bacterium]|jgi:hypothetical protein|nr:HD domain-containing protein [Ktedonobacteraceae bacterium]
MHNTHWLQIVVYRLGQVRQQLGFVEPLTVKDYAEVERWLPSSALKLFRTMSPADQQHSLRVCRGLLACGCEEENLLAAALLHDVGKAEGRVPFWTRPVIVLGKLLAPRWLKRSVIELEQLEQAGGARWRRALSYAWWHAEVGAQLAAAAGLSEQATLYIRTHHQANGPAALLHRIDEES